jgi:hypothetical protein
LRARRIARVLVAWMRPCISAKPTRAAAANRAPSSSPPIPAPRQAGSTIRANSADSPAATYSAWPITVSSAPTARHKPPWRLPSSLGQALAASARFGASPWAKWRSYKAVVIHPRRGGSAITSKSDLLRPATRMPCRATAAQGSRALTTAAPTQRSPSLAPIAVGPFSTRRWPSPPVSSSRAAAGQAYTVTHCLGDREPRDRRDRGSPAFPGCRPMPVASNSLQATPKRYSMRRCTAARRRAARRAPGHAAGRLGQARRRGDQDAASVRDCGRRAMTMAAAAPPPGSGRPAHERARDDRASPPGRAGNAAGRTPVRRSCRAPAHHRPPPKGRARAAGR